MNGNYKASTKVLSDEEVAPIHSIFESASFNMSSANKRSSVGVKSIFPGLPAGLQPEPLQELSEFDRDLSRANQEFEDKSVSSRPTSQRKSLAEFKEVSHATWIASSPSNRFSHRSVYDKAAMQHQLNIIRDDRSEDGELSMTSPTREKASNLNPPRNDQGMIVMPLPPREEDEGDEQISNPDGFLHRIHVTYNADRARYEGLSAEWKDVNKQYGVDIEEVPKVSVSGYKSRVPAILEMLKKDLFNLQGHKIEGIFRIGPDKSICQDVYNQINSGEYNGTQDVHVVANLIKRWYRELPEGIYNCCGDEDMMQISELKGIALEAKVATFKEPNQSIILWLMDMMAQIVLHENINKMSARNMAIVMAPNLRTIESEDPIFALKMAQKIADFTVNLLAARLRSKYRYETGLI